MLALADPPHTQLGHIPGLKYPPEWHREQEAKEQAWLNAWARWGRKLGTVPVNG